jgi:MFS family permease
VTGLALAHAPAIRRPVPALAALTAATFLYVTTEMLPVGLLAPIGADLGVSEARVGLLVTAYALVVVVASIPLTYLTRAVPRRVLLGTLLAGYVVSSLGSALAGRVMRNISTTTSLADIPAASNTSPTRSASSSACRACVAASSLPSMA